MSMLLVTQDFPPRLGGMAAYYGDLARGLGDTCRVLATRWNGSPPELAGVRATDWQVEANQAHRLGVRRRLQQGFEAELRDQRTELVIVGNARPFWNLLRPQLKRHNVPTAVVYHGNDLLQLARRWKGSWLRGRSWGSIVDEPTLHIVNSQFTAGLASSLGMGQDRIHVVRPEVDTQRFYPGSPRERAALRERLGWRQDEVITLFVGRLVPRKGLDAAISVLARIEGPTRLIVAGPGDPELPLSLAVQAGCVDRVSVLGAVPSLELPGLYRAADLFLAPSRSQVDQCDVEGFGIVYLEAAASGLPILATRSGGVPEAVQDGQGGYLVAENDLPALRIRWQELTGSVSLRQRMGDAGHREVCERFGPGASAVEFRKALEAAGVVPTT